MQVIRFIRKRMKVADEIGLVKKIAKYCKTNVGMKF
jgi:hypothetical protein